MMSTGCSVGFLLLGPGCSDKAILVHGRREREAATTNLKSKVRGLHVDQVLPDIEISTEIFTEAFNQWYTKVVTIAPTLENGFRLEAGVTIQNPSDIADLESPRKIVLSGKSVLDSLDIICQEYDVYFKYSDMERIEIAKDLDRLAPKQPAEIPEADDDRLEKFPVDPFSPSAQHGD